MGNLESLCGEWLYQNFEIKGEIIKVVILNQVNPVDVEYGLVGVAFDFECPDGKTGDSVAFFDKCLVEEILVKSIFAGKLTTESVQVWM